MSRWVFDQACRLCAIVFMAIGRHRHRFRKLLRGATVVEAPGVWDALTAVMAERSGFESVFLAGSGLSYTQLARPDVGLLTAAEVAQTLARIRERTDLPILVDGDSGFGNAVNLQRTIRLLERAGASGVQIEDQAPLKSPADLTGRALVSCEEMVAKIKAAQDSRDDPDLVISARTDAVFTLGVDEALRRAEAYASAGADMIFVEGLASVHDMHRLAEIMKGGPPLLHNLLAPRPGMPASAAELQDVGYSMALFPGVLVQRMAAAGRLALAELRRGDWRGALSQENNPAGGIAELVGTSEFLQRAATYAGRPDDVAKF